MSTFEDREKMLIDKLSATDPLAQVAQVAKHLPQQDATKILRYATSTGDAPDVVAQNLKAYDMDSIGSTDWENALKDAPRTKTFLSTPLPLAIVQNGDNASVLANVESENKVWSAFKDGLKDVGRTTLRFGQGALEGVLSANDTPNPATPPTASEDYLGTRLPDNYTEWAKQTQHPMLQDAAYTLKDMADSKLLTPKNQQADTVLGQYGLDVIRMIPQIAAQLAVGATAGPATALGFMGAQIAGSDYENYAKEGVDPGRAMTAALGDAALQAPLEAVGLGKIMKKIPAGTAAKERVKKYLEAGLTEGVTEWLQQYPQGAADIYAKGEGQTPQQMGQQFIEDFWKNTKEGAYQGAIAFPLGVFGGAVHHAMQRQATKAYVDNVEALQAQLAGSAILSQSPELVEQHLDAITGGEKAYIDPDALVMYQMENPKALEELGLTEQQVNAALETGEMIEVTKAQYVTAAAQDPALHEALKNDIAPSTEGLTQRRIDERKNESDVKRATDKTTEEAKALRDWSREYSRQLKEAGLDDDMAKQVIVGLQAHARTMSDKPVEWLRQNAPEFRQGGTEQPGALSQEQVKNLVALHNLSPDNFLHAVRMGGLPAPSVAISRTEHPLEKFGDITLIGSTDLVDPAQKKSKVFNADVYSPRYPTVERDIDRTALKKYEKELAGLKEYENAAPTYTDVNYLAEKAKEGKRELQYNKLAQLLFASRNGFGKEQDGTALREFIEQHKEQYSDFLDTLLADISKGERIFKGYTNSGNRRYVPHTLENVVKELIASLRDGEGFNYGVGSLRSNVAKRYTKLAQIQKDRGKIISAEDFAKEKEIVEKEFTDILAEAHEKYTGAASKYQVTDVFMDVLKDGIKRNNITAELKQYGFEGVDANRVHAFLNSIKNMPTEYFEAKLQRAVGLNEFKGALLPAGTSEKVKRHLDEMGVPYREYEEGKRQEVLDAFTKDLNAQQGNVLFQPSDPTASPAFKAWFGDSKVVDEQGKPLVVYHGTGKYGFNSFDFDKTAHGLYGMGMYFTKNKDVAGQYTKKGKTEVKGIYSTYLSLKNPLDMEAKASISEWEKSFPDADFAEAKTNAEAYRAVESFYREEGYSKDEAAYDLQETIQHGMGYDGITHIGGGIVNKDSVKHRVYIAFSPEQIKSVNNSGAFDASNPNIYLQSQMAYDISKEAGELYAAAAEKYPEIVADRKVKHRVENAIQQTLDFGQAEDDITRHETQLSLFGDDGKLAGDISGRETAKVQTKEKRAARQVGLGVTRELVNEGAVSLVGKQVHSIQELAEIAQVLRHPGYEKFHRVYADENDNIVYHETVSCMLPSEASVYAPEDNGDTINLLMRMDADIARLGAKKVYLIHNHPSTNPEPSKEDIHLTKTLANVKFSSGRPGPVNVAFAGHIVLDTDTYAKIDRDGRVFYGHIDERYRINMTDAEIPHVTLGEHAYSPDGLAAAAKQLADGSRTTAFFMTTKGRIRGVVHLPDAVAKMDPSRISRYLRWLARANYSNFCSIATSDPDAFNAYKELVDKEHLADVLLTTEGRTVRRTQPTYDTWFGIPSGKGGKRLLETGERYGQDQGSFMANGSIHWENGRAIITMMQTGNPSTVIHEMVGHFFFQNLVERSMQDDAPEQVKKDVKTLFEWAGYEGKTFDKLTREERTDLHEKVARAAEVYVMEGKAPSVATQSLFRRFAEWMKEVYRSVRELGVQVTPEVAQVFDRMLATDAEIAEIEALERYHESLPETFLATLNDRQRAHLDQELLKVRAEAEEQLRAAVMRDLRADNRAAIAEERKTAQQQIRAELEAQPLYMARAAMQAPANMKAVREAVDARIEQLINDQVQLLVQHAKLGVEGKVAIRDDEGYMTGEWLGGFSNNEQWYKDLLARLPQGRLPEAWGKYIDWVKAGSVVAEGEKPRRMPPKMRESFREIALEHLEKGWYDEQFGDIPANEEYLALRQSSPSWEIIMDNGGGLKLNEAQLAEMYPDKADKLPQNMLTKEGGFEADLLAQVFGFSSGDELLARIIDSPTLGEAVKERLQAHMQQFRDLINDKTALDGEARAAMYSDGGAALLATELQLIEEKMGKVLKAEDARQAAATAREAAKRTAQTMLAKREINEATRLQSYIAAERRAAVDTAKYLKAKDYENAAAAKERQLLNHALIMECLRIKREVERVKKYLNKQRKSKNWLSDTTDANGLRMKTNEYKEQAISILARFGFYRKDAVAPEETLAEWVKRQEDDEVNGEIINIAPWLAYDNRRSTIGKLTLEELQDVENAIRNIKKMATIGVNSDGFAFINGDGLEETVQGLLDSSARLTDKQVDRIEKEKASAVKDFFAGMRQGHRMLEMLDAFKSFGAWYQTFYDSLKRASDQRSQLLQRITDRMEQAFTSEGITKAERYRMAHKQIYVAEWGQSVTKNTLLAIALNMGNQSSLERLTATRLIGVGMATPWDVTSIKKVLEKHLTAADFRLVGNIWKAIDVYAEYNDTVQRMTGNSLPKIEPLPIIFHVNGEDTHLDGGYYPLSQDARGSKQAELNAEKKLGDAPGFMPYPSTGRSKARTKGAKYAVDTDLANLYGNMTDIVQDIAFRPVAHDLNKLMRDERVVSTFRSKLGDPAYQAFLAWQKRITSGKAENVKHPLDRFFTWARSATVISSLLLRPGVAVQNLSNILLYGNSVEGWSNRDAADAYVRHGWGDYIPNALSNSARAKALREYVYSKSTQMRDKMNAPDYSFREINDAGQQENMLMRSGNGTVQEAGYRVAQAQENLNKFASDVFAWTDQLTDIPIWLGAYEKAKAGGKTETQAVNFADAIVRNSTGTGRNLDTSNTQAAGSPAMRLFTMFQTFMNTAYNRWATEAGIFLQEKDAWRLTKFVASQYLAFGILSAFLSFHVPDEDEEWDEWFRKEVLEWPLGMIPLFGGLSKILLDKAQGFKTYSYRMTPLAGKAEDVLKLASTAEKVWQGQKEGGELVEPTAALASFFFRYPDQLNDWFFNAYDALSGNMQPELRDLVKRRPKKERM